MPDALVRDEGGARQRGLATSTDTHAAATTSSGSTEIHSAKVMGTHKPGPHGAGNKLSTLARRSPTNSERIHLNPPGSTHQLSEIRSDRPAKPSQDSCVTGEHAVGV